MRRALRAQTLSGVEANHFLNNAYSGPLHGPAPYLQSYTHDIWNNLLGRTGSYWTETEDLGQTQTYDAHNRNSAWSYDADGRLLSMNEPPPDQLPFVPAQHTYDVAGRHVKHTQTTSRVMPLPGNPVWTTVATPRPGELRYPELFGQISMEYVRVQIHETGASLSAIRNLYHPGPWKLRLDDGGLDPEHDDDGPSLEDCVGRNYYQQMGLKPHN